MIPNGIFCAWPPYTNRYQVAKAAIKHANPLPFWKVYAVEKVHYETGMLLLFFFLSSILVVYILSSKLNNLLVLAHDFSHFHIVSLLPC